MGMELVKKLREETGAGILACQKALKETSDNYEEAVDLLRKQGIAKASSKADRVASEGLCGVVSNDSGIAVVKLNCETDFVAKNEKFQGLVEKIASVALETKSKDVEQLANQTVDGKLVKDLITENIATIGENIVIGEVKVFELSSGQTANYYVHNQVEGNSKLGRIVSFVIANGAESDDAKVLLKQINMHITAMFPIALTEESVDKDVLAREKAIYEEQVAQLNKPAEISAKMVEGKIRKFFEEKVLLKQVFVMDNKRTIANVIADFNKENGSKLELIHFERISIQ